MQELTIYKPKDLQKIFGVSKNTVYSMIRQDTFPSIRVGRQYFIPKDALLNWLQTYQGKTYFI